MALPRHRRQAFGNRGSALIGGGDDGDPH
jgi:hypothetical protein